MFRNPLIDAAVVLLAVLLIFGPKRLPQLGRSLGHGMREFKDGITGQSKVSEDEERPELTQASASAPATPQQQAAAQPASPPATAATEPAGETEATPEVGSAERRS